MKQKAAAIILAVIMLVALAAHALIVTQAALPSYESYATLIQIDHIKKTAGPLIQDPLSGQGRLLVVVPFFYYAAALTSLFMSETALALIAPSILSVILVWLVYSIALLVSRRNSAALASAAAVAFLPVLFQSMFDFTPFLFALVMLLVCMLLFLKLDSRKNVFLLLICLTILVLTHPLSLFLIVVFLVYVLFLRIEKSSGLKIEMETIFLYSFLALWGNLLFFKKAFLVHGSSIIWQNIPDRIRELSFFQITFLQSFILLGVLTIVFGCVGLYLSLFKLKSKPVLFITSFVFVAFLMLWLKVIPFSEGMILFGCALAIVASTGVSSFFDYLATSRLSFFKQAMIAAMILFFVATNMISSLASGFSELEQLPTVEEQNALSWMGTHTPDSSVVFATLREGPFINAVAKRKTFLDSNFLLIPAVNERFSDALILWDGGLLGEALDRMNKYSLSYIYISPEYARTFNKQEPVYIQDSPCFKKIYDNESVVYELVCTPQIGGILQ